MLNLTLLVVGAAAVAVALRRWWRLRQWDRRVRQSGKPAYTYTFTGHDDGLRQRTGQLRERADAIHRSARRLETGSLAVVPREDRGRRSAS